MMLGMNKIGDWHLIYDGEPLSDHFIIKSVEMPLLATIDYDAFSVSGRPGKWFFDRKIETRKIVVHAAMMNDNKSRIDMMEKWVMRSRFLAKDSPKKLELGGGYYVYASIVGDTPIKRENGIWSEVNITFICYDPFIYGEEKELDILYYDRKKIYIEGSSVTYPYLTLHPIPGNDDTSQLVVDRRSWDDNNNVISSSRLIVNQVSNIETIIVDSENRICYDGNNVYLPIYLDSQFPVLTPGLNEVNIFTKFNGTIKYKERYL